METFRLKSARFRAERAESWQELETLLDRIERGGTRGLSGEELERLPVLYRGAVSSLSVARSVSLDRNVLEYLEGLVGRAYFAVYARPRPAAWTALRFVTHGFPGVVRRYAGYLALSMATMLLGLLAGVVLTTNEIDRFYAIVPDAYSQGRNPAASTEELREVLYTGGTAHAEDDGSGDGEDDDEGEIRSDRLGVFASQLFSHNAGIGILCFALGFVAGAPTLYLLFYNGLLLGAFAGLYQQRGLGSEFWAWVLPHGVTELLAVVLCGMAGLMIGGALVFPSPRGRLRGLADRGREAALVVVGSILLFFIAALIEGFFRQLVGSPVIRWAVVGITATLWTLYFGLAGRGDVEDDGLGLPDLDG